MKRYIFVVLIFFFACQSHVFGQITKFGIKSVPSEGGNKSGGGGKIYNPDQGREFMLGNGGTTIYPDNRQTFRQYQPEYPNNSSQGYPRYQQGIQNQVPDLHLLYHRDNFQQTYPQWSQQQSYGLQQNGIQQSGIRQNVLPQNVLPQQSTLNATTYSGGQDIPTSPEMSNQFISISCPASAVGSIYYTLTSNRGTFGFSMSAGQEQRFRIGSGGWKISYNNGVTEKRYQLKGGTRYFFKPNSANQWQILASK